MANYWNSTIPIRPGAKRLKSKTAMKRSAIQRSKRPMKKVGRRTKSWRYAWRFLKPELEKRGRVTCEFGFIPHECGGFLTPAHSKKRRMMKGDDVFAIGLACVNVHRI